MYEMWTPVPISECYQETSTGPIEGLKFKDKHGEAFAKTTTGYRVSMRVPDFPTLHVSSLLQPRRLLTLKSTEVSNSLLLRLGGNCCCCGLQVVAVSLTRLPEADLSQSLMCPDLPQLKQPIFFPVSFFPPLPAPLPVPLFQMPGSFPLKPRSPLSLPFLQSLYKYGPPQIKHPPPLTTPTEPTSIIDIAARLTCSM